MSTAVHTAPSPSGGGTVPALTDRELLVLKRVAGGDTYAAVARSLGISHNTAEWYGKQVIRKLGAKSIAHAVFLACHAGILDGSPRPHGNHAGAMAHRRRGEELCESCKEGDRAYHVAHRAAQKAKRNDAA